jgi:hypothetical protein
VVVGGGAVVVGGGAVVVGGGAVVVGGRGAVVVGRGAVVPGTVSVVERIVPCPVVVFPVVVLFLCFGFFPCACFLQVPSCLRASRNVRANS